MSRWRQELRANPRLRAGMALVAGLVWLLGLLELLDVRDAAEKERARVADELVRLQAVAAERQWPERRDAARQRLADFRSLARREESEGRIQATMQDWLREQLTAVGLQARDLQVVVLPAGGPASGDAARRPALAADMRLARARLSFDFRPDGLHRLLAALPASRHWIWVSRLVVGNDSRRTVELELEALFVLGPRENP
jgi:hypothetical protein